MCVYLSVRECGEEAASRYFLLSRGASGWRNCVAEKKKLTRGS